jgi:DNA modification methylase
MILTRYGTPAVNVWHGDALRVLRAMQPESVTSIITDPPYGLSDVSSAEVVQAITAWASGDRERVPDGRGFMSLAWDRFVPPPAVWDECLRVLKPGGYMAVFAGTRTADLMGLSIRLAGFRMYDTITWMYSSGMPKGLNVGKAIDKAAGAEREVIGEKLSPDGIPYSKLHGKLSGRTGVGIMGTATKVPRINELMTAPSTDDAKQWEGWNTQLKPAGEPIIIAQKSFTGPIINNVLKHGTGAMNIEACRVGGKPRTTHARGNVQSTYPHPMSWGKRTGHEVEGANQRWPANVVLSHGEDCVDTECVEGCAIVELDNQTGVLTSGYMRPEVDRKTRQGAAYGKFSARTATETYADCGGASRFYPTFRYQAKAPKSERPVVDGVAHPTVKPLALISWLVTLFTAPHGLVLDPFGGTATTGQAAQRLGHPSVIIENNSKYLPLIAARLGASDAVLPR